MDWGAWSEWWVGGWGFDGSVAVNGSGNVNVAMNRGWRGEGGGGESEEEGESEGGYGRHGPGVGRGGVFVEAGGRCRSFAASFVLVFFDVLRIGAG